MQLTNWTLIAIFVMASHWFADFVMQSNQMALNKSKSLKWLSVHIAVYTYCMLMMTTFWTSLYFQRPYLSYDSWEFCIAWCGLNGLLHLLTDFVTSRITSWYWKREARHAFFIMIGLDQLIHISTLLITLDLMT